MPPLEKNQRMKLRSAHVSACLLAGAAFWGLCPCLTAQTDKSSTQSTVTLAELPDAPLPQQQTPGRQPDSPAPANPAASADSSSSSSSATSASGSASDTQAPATQSGDTASQKTQREIAEDQLKQQKKQRIGILPNFNASYISGAVPLTPGEKFRLMFSTEKDPATFGFSMFVALIGQAEGSHPAYGGGIGGYGKRFGQNYADTFRSEERRVGKEC